MKVFVGKLQMLLYNMNNYYLRLVLFIVQKKLFTFSIFWQSFDDLVGLKFVQKFINRLGLSQTKNKRCNSSKFGFIYEMHQKWWEKTNFSNSFKNEKAPFIKWYYGIKIIQQNLFFLASSWSESNSIHRLEWKPQSTVKK